MEGGSLSPLSLMKEHVTKAWVDTPLFMLSLLLSSRAQPR